jgi:hypothetical protein
MTDLSGEIAQHYADVEAEHQQSLIEQEALNRAAAVAAPGQAYLDQMYEANHHFAIASSPTVPVEQRNIGGFWNGMWAGAMTIGRAASYPARWFGADFSRQDAELNQLWYGNLNRSDTFTRPATEFAGGVGVRAAETALTLGAGGAALNWLGSTSAGSAVLGSSVVQTAGTAVGTAFYYSAPVIGAETLAISYYNGEAAYYSAKVGDYTAAGNYANDALFNGLFADSAITWTVSRIGLDRRTTARGSRRNER